MQSLAGHVHMTVSIYLQIGAMLMIDLSKSVANIYIVKILTDHLCIRFLYMLILAMDANYQLSNRICLNDRDDPELGPGYAYFQNQKPYAEFLKDYINEVDVSRGINLTMYCVLNVLTD